jgi:hypothetical protein
VKAADWLLSLLDQPTGVQPGSGAGHDYHLPAQEWDIKGGLAVRVAAIAHADTSQELQEIANVTRSIADVQRCYPVQSRKVLVIRGTDDQIAVVDWLLQQLDGPTGQGTNEFKMGGGADQIVQVAYVNADTPQSLRETVSEIQTATKMARVFPFDPQKAVAMRGTTDQLAGAQQVIQSRKNK